MKPFNSGGHSAYQNRVLTQLRKYYPDAVNSLPASTWQLIEKFWNLDLSQIDIIMQDRYSTFGPAPRLPSDMMRALLVTVALKITSYTKFAADLKENHLHAILCGFTVGDTSGVVLFMTSRNAFGYRMIRIFPILFIHLRKNQLSLKVKKKKHHLLKK